MIYDRLIFVIRISVFTYTLSYEDEDSESSDPNIDLRKLDELFESL